MESSHQDHLSHMAEHESILKKKKEKEKIRNYSHYGYAPTPEKSLKQVYRFHCAPSQQISHVNHIK